MIFGENAPASVMVMRREVREDIARTAAMFRAHLDTLERIEASLFNPQRLEVIDGQFIR